MKFKAIHSNLLMKISKSNNLVFLAIFVQFKFKLNVKPSMTPNKKMTHHKVFNPLKNEPY